MSWDGGAALAAKMWGNQVAWIILSMKGCDYVSNYLSSPLLLPCCLSQNIVSLGIMNFLVHPLCGYLSPPQQLSSITPSRHPWHRWHNLCHIQAPIHSILDFIYDLAPTSSQCHDRTFIKYFLFHKDIGFVKLNMWPEEMNKKFCNLVTRTLITCNYVTNQTFNSSLNKHWAWTKKLVN